MFTLRISTDNDAFAEDDRAEVAAMLRKVADALDSGTCGAPLYDFNGNQVGRFDLVRQSATAK